MAVSVGAIEATLELKDRMSAALKKAGGNLGKLEGKMSKLSTGASGLGRSLTMGLTAPLVAIGGGAIKAAIDFESSFAGVRKTVDATEAEFAKLSQGFRDMAKEIPINVNELNRIGEAAGQLGIKKENIVAFTRTMADLGVTTNMAAEEAATSLARFANITGMAQGDFDRLGSTIVDLGNKFATTEGEIVEMGLRLAGAGAQIGMTESEIMGMAAALSSVGIRAEAGGTAMSRVMIDIATSVSIGDDKLKLFAKTAGMSVDQFARLFNKDSASAIKSFVQGLGKVSEEGNAVFGVLEEMGFANIRTRDSLLRSAGASDLFARALETANAAFKENTALAEEAEKRYATVASQLQILWNNIKDLAIDLGTELLPVFLDLVDVAKSFVPKLKDMISGFKELSPEAQKLRIAFVAIAAITGPGLIFLGSVGSLATGIIATAGAVKGLALSIGLARAASLGWIGLGLAAVGGLVWVQTKKMNEEFEAMESSLTAGTRVWKEHNGVIKVSTVLLKKIADGTADLTEEEQALVAEFKKQNRVIDKSDDGMQGLGRSIRIVGDAAADLAHESVEVNKELAEFKRGSDRAARAIKVLTDAQKAIVNTWKNGAIPAAIDYMAALKEIGGLSKLSAKEQDDLNTALEAALVDYRLLGEEAPAAMRAVAAATREVLEATAIDFPLFTLGDMPGGWKQMAADFQKRVEQSTRGGIKLDFLPTLDPEKMPSFGQRFGQRFTDGWQSVIKNIPNTVSDAFKGGGNLFGAFKSLGSQLGAAFGESIGSSIGDSIGKSAGKFAQAFGAMAGPMGAAIGSLVGPVIEGVKKLFGGRSVQRNIEITVKRKWGHSLSKGLQEAIAETSKTMRSDYAAVLSHLGDIFDEAGGVMAFGLSRAIGAVHDLFSMVNTGQMSAQQASAAFDTAFSKIAEAAVGTGEIVGRSFTELIDLAKEFGFESAAMLDFVRQQSENTATGIESIANAGIKSKEEINDLGLVAVASFESALAAGMSFTEAVRAHGPAIDALIIAQEKLGVTSDNVAIQELANFQALIKGNQSLVQGVEALDDTMLALSRTGSLNAETLGAMERQGVRMFDKLIEKGFSQQQALLMMGPAIKTIMDAHSKLGIPISENTQKLIDQAREAGALEATQKTGWAAVAEAVNKVVEKLDEMIGRISGVDRGLRNIPKDVRTTIHIREERRRSRSRHRDPNDDDDDEDEFMAHGGIVTRPTRAIIGEAGPEAVIPLSDIDIGNKRLLDEVRGLRTELRRLPIHLRDAIILAS